MIDIVGFIVFLSVHGMWRSKGKRWQQNIALDWSSAIIELGTSRIIFWIFIHYILKIKG